SGGNETLTFPYEITDSVPHLNSSVSTNYRPTYFPSTYDASDQRPGCGARPVRDRSFLALCALILVNQMGFGIITPVLPAYARSFGLDASSVGLVIGIYGFARFLANVPAGQLAERRGRRQVLIVGTVITSVASALIATATSLPLLLAYRLLAGL